jgi:hypothetical protein
VLSVSYLSESSCSVFYHQLDGSLDLKALGIGERLLRVGGTVAIAQT